ncbi:MAG: ATP-binding protein [Bdellovibrionota bacterium]|nr:ATP-binding protein [Bdellovibrionota bacterium]
MEKVGFSIRYKFLLLISGLLLASVVAYLGLANHVFSEDKTELVFDYNRSFVANLSSELDKVFESIEDKIRLSSILLEKEGQDNLIERLFEQDKNLAYLAIKPQRTQRFKKIMWKDDFFESYGYNAKNFQEELLSDSEIPLQTIKEKGYHLWKPKEWSQLPMAAFATTKNISKGGRVQSYMFLVIVRFDQLGIQENQNRLSEVFLFNQKGELLFSDSQQEIENLSFLEKTKNEYVKTSVFQYTESDQRYLAAFSKSFANKLLVVSRVSTEKALAVVWQFVYRSILFASIFLTLAFIVAILFSRSLTKPIDKLLAAMKKVASGDLSISIKLHTKDEIRVLAENFNTMICDLKSSRDELESINRELENKVKERTKQLEEQNLAVKKAQEALLRTSRLAAAGEIAGRAAHEVLNPLTSILTRIQKVDKRLEHKKKEDLILLDEITTAWKKDLESGKEHLWNEWNQKSTLNPDKSLLEEDVENISQIYEGLNLEFQEMKQDLGFLLGEGHRINRIVQSMRSLNRTSGDHQIYPLMGLIDESYKIMADAMDEASIKFIFEDQRDEINIKVDKDEFVQALTNLFRNSIQALRPVVDETRFIQLSFINQEEDWVQFQIIDNGIGIALENQQKLFESQFSTKAASEGTGLGLSISRRFIRSFNGDLFLKSSEPGKGSVFQIDLPIATKQGRVSA